MPTVVRVLIVFAALIAIAFGAYVIARIRDRGVVRKLEGDIKRKGEPLTLADLAERYKQVADDENAAIPLLNVWEKDNREFWAAFRLGQRPLPQRPPARYERDLPYLGKNRADFSPGQPLSADSRQASEAFLQLRATHIKADRAAIQRKQCHFPVVIGDGLHALLPHLNELRTEAQTLRIAALLAAERNERDEALTALEDIVKLGDLLRSEPVTISQLVRIAIFRIAVLGTQDLVSRRALSPAELRRLHDLLNSVDIKGILRAALQYERVAVLSSFDLSARELPQLLQSNDNGEANLTTGYTFLTRGIGISGAKLADRRLMLETSGQFIQIVNEEWPEAVSRSKELAATFPKKGFTFPPKLFSALLLPASARIVERFATAEAERRCALIALGVEQYGRAHSNTVPDSVRALVPQYMAEIPRDPFDGEQLRFRQSATNYVVYSIGANMRDDGAVSTATETSKSRDVCFLVNRASVAE